jgi:predicted nucleotidyltransferase
MLKKTNNIADALFGSTKLAILSLLFGNPEKSFYLRQIVRSTGGGIGAIQRELVNLTASGILIRDRMGNQVHYQANKSNPVFAELKGLVAKTVGVYGIIKNALIPIKDEIKIAFVYGSFARGEETATSDIDLMVIGDASPVVISSALHPLHEKLGREINPTIYNTDDFIDRISSGNHFILSVIREPKYFLVGTDDDLRRLGDKRLA